MLTSVENHFASLPDCHINPGNSKTVTTIVETYLLRGGVRICVFVNSLSYGVFYTMFQSVAIFRLR